jgi:hypothetical protein
VPYAERAYLPIYILDTDYRILSRKYRIFFSNRIDSCCRASLEEITQRHLTSLSYVLSTGSKVALPPSLCGVLWPVSFEDAPTSGSPTNNIIFLKLILFGKQLQLRLLNG